MPSPTLHPDIHIRRVQIHNTPALRAASSLKFKLASVEPMYKDGERNDSINFSTTDNMKNVRNSHKTSYRRRKLTMSGMIQMVDGIVNHLEAGEEILLSIYDLLKAFDAVCQNVLLGKLEYYRA